LPCLNATSLWKFCCLYFSGGRGKGRGEGGKRKDAKVPFTFERKGKGGDVKIVGNTLLQNKKERKKRKSLITLNPVRP